MAADSTFNLLLVTGITFLVSAIFIIIHFIISRKRPKSWSYGLTSKPTIFTNAYAPLTIMKASASVGSLARKKIVFYGADKDQKGIWRAILVLNTRVNSLASLRRELANVE